MIRTQETIRAVFWDMDGTLIDTEFLHYEVARDWCAGHGYALTEEANEGLLGKTMTEKWRLLRSKLDAQAEFHLFEQWCAQEYLKRLDASMRRDDTAKVVRELAARGVVQACVSNGDPEVVEANLRIVELEDCMNFYICSHDVDKGKPHADPYLAAAERAGFDPAQCLAVEDSNVGLISARAAGCVVCAWPMEQDASLPKVDFVLRTPKDFPRHLLG